MTFLTSSQEAIIIKDYVYLQGTDDHEKQLGELWHLFKEKNWAQMEGQLSKQAFEVKQ